MRPLPPTANKIYDLVYYKANFKKAEKLFNEISDPVEKMLSRVMIAHFKMWFAEDNELKIHLDELKKASKSLNDEFHRLWALFIFYSLGRFYFAGGNNPSFDENIAREYSKKAVSLVEGNTEIIKNVDPWFSLQIEAMRLYHLSFSEENNNKKIKLMYKTIDAISKVPIDGPQIKYYGTFGQIAQIKIHEGKLEEARKLYNKFDDAPVLHFWFRHVRDNNLAFIEYLSGNLNKAIKICNNLIEDSRKQNFFWGLARVQSQLANYLTAKGEFEQAEGFYLESLELRKNHANPVEATIGYYDLIRLLTIEFQLTNDRSILTKANDYFKEMEQNSNKYLNNVTVSNFTNICKAILGKFGRLKARVKAQEILEEMVNFYPHYFSFKLDLIELLLEEAQLSDEPEIIEQLDKLMTDLADVGLFKSNTTPSRFIQLQILVARYEMYVKANVDQALLILQRAQNKIEHLDLQLLLNQINLEIEGINEKIKQWEIRDLSLQERLKKGEIDKYIKNALPVLTNWKNSSE